MKLRKVFGKSGVSWRVQVAINGRRYSKTWPPGSDPKLVKADFERIKAQVATFRAGLSQNLPFVEPTSIYNIGDLFARVMEMRKQELHEKSITTYRTALRRFEKCVGSHLPVDRLRQEHIENFKSWRLHQGGNKRGVNKELQWISATFGYATRAGLIKAHGLTFKKYRVENKYPHVLSHEQVRRLKNILRGKFKFAFYLFIYTLCRRGELMETRPGDGTGLRWRDVDFNNNQIRIVGKKKQRIIPMHPTVRKILQMRKDKLGAKWHPDSRVVPMVGVYFTRAFRKILEREGMYARGNVLHMLRHSAATEHYRQNRDLLALQQLLGHADIKTTTIYTHLVNDDKVDGLNRLRY